jgi:phosphoribosylformylglycinamidine cyclo-ligase
MSSAGESAYGAAGVDYETLDAGKRNALTEALATSPALLAAPGGGRAVDESRGEPAFVFEAGGQTLAFVVEGLGTKSMIARACEDQFGAGGFHAVAYDTVAAIVNDLCCVGAVPLVVNAYFATGASDWYSHADRQAGLLAGWRQACEDAGATWGGGESPALKGLVSADEIELAGSAVGLVPGGSPVLGADLADGDEIVFVDSSGLHANGGSRRNCRAATTSNCPAAPRSGGRCWSRA